MKALLVVAHGSRLQSSNAEVEALVAALTSEMTDEFPVIQCSFLEFASPSIEEGVKRCIQQGGTSVTLLPYFLSAGKHVQSDIPEEATVACQQYQLPLTILPHIGLSQQMIPLLQKAAAVA